MAALHTIDFRVYYEDTDFSGFVYHANYLRFLERARTELLRSLGITQSSLHRDEAGLVFVVTRLTIDYLKPARMDDKIVIATSVAEVRGPLLRLRQEVLRETDALVRAEVSIVAVRDGRVVRLPPGLRAAFEAARETAAD